MDKSNETLNDTKRRIKGELIACAYALHDGPNNCSDKENEIILKKMLGCIETIKQLNDRLKGPPVTVKNKPKQKKKTKPKFDSRDELNNYLKSHLTDESCYNKLITTPIGEIGNDLKDMANHLKDTNDRADGTILQVYYILGSQLNNARAKFNKKKERPEKWGEWIKKNVGLSISHCSKIRVVANLLNKYPKLLKLKGISFTELYNLRKEIIDLFSAVDNAKNWPDEPDLCMICAAYPRVTTGFTSCEHGQHYCKSCIDTLMKDRKTKVEVVHNDEQNPEDRWTESWTETIRGKRCPECRQEIVLPRKPVTHNYNLRPRRK
jgi:hypothetical protein